MTLTVDEIRKFVELRGGQEYEELRQGLALYSRTIEKEGVSIEHKIGERSNRYETSVCVDGVLVSSLYEYKDPTNERLNGGSTPGVRDLFETVRELYLAGRAKVAEKKKSQALGKLRNLLECA